jgi:hypothetical protein
MRYFYMHDCFKLTAYYTYNWLSINIKKFHVRKTEDCHKMPPVSNICMKKIPERSKVGSKNQTEIPWQETLHPVVEWYD